MLFKCLVSSGYSVGKVLIKVSNWCPLYNFRERYLVFCNSKEHIRYWPFSNFYLCMFSYLLLSSLSCLVSIAVEQGEVLALASIAAGTFG